MADQVTVGNEEGQGDDYVVSTDDAGASGHVQRVKLALSADGSAAHATVDADGVLVNLGTNNDVSVTGTVAVTQSGTWDEVGINDSGNSITVDDGGSTLSIDDGGGSITVDGIVTASGDHTVVGKAADGAAVSGNPVLVAGQDGTNVQSLKTDSTGSLQVDVESSALPSGAATAANQTTVIGHLDGVEGLLTTIDGDTGTVAGAVSGTEMQVDVVAALPAGTNNIGDVDIASIAAGDNNIGNVDIASIAAGDNNIGNVDVASVPAPLSTTGGGTEAAALRVTVASDSTGVLSVDDNGSSLTVDGTVTANAGTGTMNVKEANGATSALTTVADTASSTSILASNANRLQATITNDSSARLYLRFEAAAASSSNYGVSLAQHETWVEDVYTGEIRGIWGSDPGDGAARVTEITA